MGSEGGVHYAYLAVQQAHTVRLALEAYLFGASVEKLSLFKFASILVPPPVMF